MAKFESLVGGFSRGILLLSSQSRASLSKKWGLTEKQTQFVLAHFFKSKGIDAVLDIEVFVHLVRGWERAAFLEAKETPMLSSECPGWVCYLEKVLGEKYIKYASTVKPPQLVAATVVRKVFANMDPPVDPLKMFVGLIAPCFDKKLEAAREEVRRERPVIDLVLASNEIDQFLSKSIPDFALYYKASVHGRHFVVDFCRILVNNRLTSFSSSLPSPDHFALPIDQFTLLRGVQSHGDSNGYLTHIISHLPGVRSVKHRAIKNNNFTEVRVELASGEALLFAYVYGFKNIQNLIRRIKMKKCKYRYVEVMACPLGCLNGGGQLPLKKQEVLLLSQTSLADKLESSFEKELTKLRTLFSLEDSGGIDLEQLKLYQIEPVQEKDPLRIKW